MRFTEASGRKVVSTSSANTVGLVRNYLVDPVESKVVGLALSKTSGDGTILPWADITGFGADAVTVAGEHLVVAADEHFAALDGKHKTMLGKRVLSTGGLQLGSVQDVDFDPTDGHLISLLLEQGPIDGNRLRGVGSYAVVVA